MKTVAAARYVKGLPLHNVVAQLSRCEGESWLDAARRFPLLVTGFYEFVRMTDGKPTPSPSRFTMLVTKRDGEWRIAHHHSAPRPQPPK